MPADGIVVTDSSNISSNKWRDKYRKLEVKRNALRQAVKLLEQQINKVQAENIHLKKAYEEEKVKNNLNDCGQNNFSSRVCLENEIAAMKSEILSLQKKDQSAVKEAELLQTHVSERDSEIKKLRELLETEKRKADSERKNAFLSKKEASEAYRLAKAEKSMADEQKKHYSGEAEKNKEYRQQLKVLKGEADGLKLKLAAETTLLLDTRKKLEAERMDAINEKKRTDLEMSKAKDQQVRADENEKLAKEEKSRAEKLFRQLEEKRSDAEKLQRQVEEILAAKESKEAPRAPHKKHSYVEKIAVEKGRLQLDTSLREADESILKNSSKFVARNRKVAAETDRENLVGINKSKPTTEKDHIDQMSHDLEENKRKVDDLYMRLQELSSSVRKLTKATDKAFAAENEKMKLLKKQLKFEEMKAKHAKREVKLEKSRNIVLTHELGRIKRELVRYLRRLDTLSKSFPNEGENTNDHRKRKRVSLFGL